MLNSLGNCVFTPSRADSSCSLVLGTSDHPFLLGFGGEGWRVVGIRGNWAGGTQLEEEGITCVWKQRENVPLLFQVLLQKADKDQIRERTSKFVSCAKGEVFQHEEKNRKFGMMQ